MKLKSTRAVRIGNRTFARGAEVVLADAQARDYVEQGYLEKTADPKSGEQKATPVVSRTAKAEK